MCTQSTLLGSCYCLCPTVGTVPSLPSTSPVFVLVFATSIPLIAVCALCQRATHTNYGSWLAGFRRHDADAAHAMPGHLAEEHVAGAAMAAPTCS
jgi:hypothetical protein